ncbi:MAG: RNA 2',3'-cyclic phosphodiesterase [Syntrophotaleaceae bacterium]
MDKIRTFIAIPLNDSLFRTIAEVQRDLKTALPGIRWVRPETIHLTLAFLGDIPEEFLEKIGNSMLSIGRSFAPFKVRIADLGAFPSRKRPRVIWLGVERCAPLMQLQAELAEKLAAIDLPGENRPYTPHLTLGRSRRPDPGAESILESRAALEIGILPVDCMVLFESRLQAGGAVHIPRHTVALGG